MAEQIEQLMRQVKLGGMAKGWRSVPYENTEQYVTDLLTLELQEREANRINRMVKTAGFRVMKTLDDFVWNSAIELPGGLTQEYMTDLHFLAPKENLIFMGSVGTGKTHLANLTSWSLREGGSTITQQLAKNLYFTQEKSFIRKIAEMFMAFRLENAYTKDEILELYVNSIYFGDGYYCIYDASQGYFGKAPIDMTDYECTLLAGIPNAPSIYSLTANPELAEQRQEYVVQKMIQYGYISESEAQTILQEQS